MLKVVQTDQVGQLSAADVAPGSLLDELAREGARRMLAAALKAEADAYVDACWRARRGRASAGGA